MLIMAFGMNLFAQRADPSMNERQLERMKAELALSEAQYSRLKEGHEDFVKAQASLRADTALTREKAMAARKAMMERRTAAIKDILSKEQYEKWMAMKPGAERHSRPERPQGNSMEDMKRELGLSDEQVKKVKDLNSQMTISFQKLRADTTASRANRTSALKEIVADRNEKIKKVLTEDQYEKFIAYEKAKAQMRKRGTRPGQRH